MSAGHDLRKAALEGIPDNMYMVPRGGDNKEAKAKLAELRTIQRKESGEKWKGEMVTSVESVMVKPEITLEINGTEVGKVKDMMIETMKKHEAKLLKEAFTTLDIENPDMTPWDSLTE